MSTQSKARDAFRHLVTVVAIVAGFSIDALHPADAQGLASVTCTGVADVYYTPGLTDTPQLVDVDTDENALCISIGLPLLGTAHVESHFPATLSCQHLASPPPAGSTTIEWSDGSTSTFAWTAQEATLVRLQSQTVITKNAHVVAGRFNGKSIVETRVLLNTDLDGCSTTGVDHLQGNVTFSIY